MAIVVTACAAMIALPFFIAPKAHMSGEMGLCLPSPNIWNISPLASWMMNTVLISILVAGAWMLNRRYNFIKSTNPVLPAIFLILIASDPWITSYLSASNLVCALVVMSLSILFGCYRVRNASQEMFVIGTFISVGSMCQYGLLPFLIPLVLSAVIMKAFRFREFVAMGMGLIAPYWVGLGMGIIPLSALKMPEISNLFDGLADSGDLLVLIISVATAVFMGLLLGLNNAVKLYAGNSRINAMNLAINLTGLTAAVASIVDFSNMTTYLSTIYFAVAVQFANLCALWTLKREWIAVAVPGVVYAGFFIVMFLT